MFLERYSYAWFERFGFLELVRKYRICMTYSNYSTYIYIYYMIYMKIVSYTHIYIYVYVDNVIFSYQ